MGIPIGNFWYIPGNIYRDVGKLWIFGKTFLRHGYFLGFCRDIWKSFSNSTEYLGFSGFFFISENLKYLRGCKKFGWISIYNY